MLNRAEGIGLNFSDLLSTSNIKSAPIREGAATALRENIDRHPNMFVIQPNDVVYILYIPSRWLSVSGIEECNRAIITQHNRALASFCDRHTISSKTQTATQIIIAPINIGKYRINLRPLIIKQTFEGVISYFHFV